MQRYRVTKAIYHQGHYYVVGDVVENDGSLARLFGWEKTDSPVSEQPAEADPALAGKTKLELLDLAVERGVEVPSGSTKATIRELLEQ